MAKSIELERFSKKEIIDALSWKFDWLEANRMDYTISDVVLYIQQQRQKKMINEQMELHEQGNVALTNFINWKNEMFDKYGKDNKLNLLDIPHNDIEKGAKLEEAWQSIYRQEQQLEQKIRESFGGKICNQ